MCVTCALHAAWTSGPLCVDTLHHVVCASVFQLIVRVFRNEGQLFRSRLHPTILKALVKDFFGILPLYPLLYVKRNTYIRLMANIFF